MCKCTHFLPTKPPLSRFLQCLGINLGHPKLVGNAAVQGARPRSCGRTLCLSATPPSAARRPATTSKSPWARVTAVAGVFFFSLGPCSAATHARGGNMVLLRHMPGAAIWYLGSLYFSESLMKGRRALPTAEALTGQKTPPAAASTAIIKLQRT